MYLSADDLSGGQLQYNYPPQVSIYLLIYLFDDLLGGKLQYNYPPQVSIYLSIYLNIRLSEVVELEKLRRELAYRRQLNEQQNNMISQQRQQLSSGQEYKTFIVS